MQKGDSFENTFVITTQLHEGFIELFNDRHPLHTNAYFAQNKGFRSEIMHGNILGGFLSYFIGECLPIKNVIIHSQEIFYLNPVYLQDKLIFNARVSDIFESVNVMEFKFTFENSENLKVARGKIQIGLI